MNHQDQNEYVAVDGFQVKRREFLALLSGTLAAGALASPTSLLAAAAKGGVLQVGSGANPSSLDPATGGAGSDHVFLFPIYDTLIEWTYDTLEARPGLAREWTFEDSQTLVLTLEEGVKFHDGTAFDAEAVKFNLDRNRSDQRSNIQSDLASIESVEATGEFEATLRLNQPDTALPLILSDRAGMMVSPKSIEEFGERSDRNPVGAGAMRFVDWADGASVVLERNPDYWKQGRPRLDGIEFKIIPNGATRLRSVMSGQANLAYQLSGRQLPIIERVPSLQASTGPTVYTFQIYLNSSRGPLQDVRVRKALNYAVDREAFVQATMGGAGEPAYMNLPQSHWAYAPEVAELYSYDPEKARALLAEAGYPDGIELDMRGYNDQDTVQKEEFLLSQFEKAGVRGRFINGTIAEASSAFFGREKAGDILLSAWTGRPDPTLTYTLMFSEDSYYNPGRVAPPDGYMEALAASRATDDQAEREKALAEVQMLAMNAALVVPLAFRQSIVVSGSQVEGFRNNLLGKPKFDDVVLSGG